MTVDMESTHAATATQCPAARTWFPLSVTLGTLSRSSMTFIVELDLPHSDERCVDGDYANVWVEVLTESYGVPCCELLDLEVQVGGDKHGAAAYVRDHLDRLAGDVVVR